MSYSGKYQVKNKQKYRGKVNDVQYRSLWELHLMKHLDFNQHVRWWSSEETIIPYFSEIEEKNRRYFMDFTVCYNDGSMYLWEVKPLKQCQPPPIPKRKTERFLDELKTWNINLCKWKAAKSLCDKKGWKFKIITEKTLREKFGMKI